MRNTSFYLFQEAEILPQAATTPLRDNSQRKLTQANNNGQFKFLSELKLYNIMRIQARQSKARIDTAVSSISNAPRGKVQEYIIWQKYRYGFTIDNSGSKNQNILVYKLPN
ncbi:hypothetical protein Drorol1_Dr00005866 [Drosera rotundifolia]